MNLNKFNSIGNPDTFKPNIHASFRTSYDIYMKLRPVTKTYKWNTLISKRVDDETMLAKHDAIVFLLIFLANLQPYGGRIPDVWPIKIKFSLTISFYLFKIWKQNKEALILLPWVKVLFWPKRLIFAKKC